jgi:hypothetical protein
MVVNFNKLFFAKQKDAGALRLAKYLSFNITIEVLRQFRQKFAKIVHCLKNAIWQKRFSFCISVCAKMLVKLTTDGQLEVV